MTTKLKPGILHLAVILIVLAVSAILIGVVFKVIPRIKAQLSGQPQGKIMATPTTTSNKGSIKLTAKDVVGVTGAQIDYVRYYLLNPALATGNTWGNPNWCTGVNPCTQSTNAQFKTYDIGESSNPGNNFEMTWNGSTKSPDSAGTDRSLSATNIPPGTYTLALKIRDVNGNENGSASTLTVVIENAVPKGTLNLSKTTVSNQGTISLSAINVAGVNGAQIDYITYYIINPVFGPGNNWGNPSWCALVNPCTQSTQGLATYDLAQTSNPANNYKVIWDKTTLSSGSTQYSRAFTHQNIKPGLYWIGLKVADVAGNVNGNASSQMITVVPCYDVNGNNKVDVVDLQAIAAHNGQSGTGLVWDLNYSGSVNVVDLNLAALQGNKTCP